MISPGDGVKETRGFWELWSKGQDGGGQVGIQLGRCNRTATGLTTLERGKGPTNCWSNLQLSVLGLGSG